MYKGLFALLSLLAVRQVQGQNAFWKYPQAGGHYGEYDDNFVMQVGSTQTLSWYSALSTATVILVQEKQHERGSWGEQTIARDFVGNRFEWKVDVTNFDVSKSEVFLLLLNTEFNGDVDFEGGKYYSHYFNITEAEVFSTTLNAITAAPVAATAAITVTMTSAPESNSESLSVGAAAGIAVGATLAVVLAIAGALLLWRRKAVQNRRRNDPFNGNHDHSNSHNEVAYNRSTPYDTVDVYAKRTLAASEMDSSIGAIQELSAGK